MPRPPALRRQSSPWPIPGEAASPGIARLCGVVMTRIRAMLPTVVQMTAASALWKPNPSLMVPCPGGARCRRRMTALLRLQAMDRIGPQGRRCGSRQSGMGGSSRPRVSPGRHPPRSPDRPLGPPWGMASVGLPGTPPSSPCGTCRVRTLDAPSQPFGTSLVQAWPTSPQPRPAGLAPGARTLGCRPGPMPCAAPGAAAARAPAPAGGGWMGA